MMYAVVYLSSKLGQVTGKGLFDVIKDHYSRWLLWPILIGVLIGNTIEAGADLGGMAAAINLFVPVPIPLLVVALGSIILALQILGSYELIRNVFRWFALALLAYVGAAILAKPDPMEMLRGTFIPSIQFTGEYLAILVAVIGTTLSAYLTLGNPMSRWRRKFEGPHAIGAAQGASDEELRKSRMDIVLGMLFSNVIMYAIILSTSATCTIRPDRHRDGRASGRGAAAARRRRRRGSVRTGLIGVGFLAVPIMTTERPTISAR